MRIFSSNQHLYIDILDEYGKVINEQILIISGSGGGKTLAKEGIREEYHKKGYLTFIFDADPKGKMETAFEMFEPQEQYHLNHLRKIGKNPEGKNIKIYHPYTENIPKTKLPKINFYTLSLKDLGRKEWGLIAETDYDKEVVSLMINASNSISKEEGVYSFLHKVQDMIKSSGDSENKADPNNFFLDAGSGTMKSITEISRYFKAFDKDSFLAKENCPYNLNWKEIFEDQESYHFFTCKWIRDEKTKDFVILSLLESLLRNSDLLKRPVLIDFPEIRRLVEFKPEGHKIYLAKSIKGALSIMRSAGRGMTSLSDSQVMEDIDVEVSNSATKTLLGQIGGASDLDKICKRFSYKREIKEKLKNMPYRNSFLLVGKEDEDNFTIFFGSGCHAEPNYNFIEMYKKKGLEMYDYSELHNNIKKMIKEDKEKIKERVKKRQKAERERKEKEKAEKEANKQENKQIEKKIEKAKEKEKTSDLMKGKMIHQLRKNEPNLSLRKQCERLDIPVGSKGKLDSWEKEYLDSLETSVPGLEPINQEKENGYDLE